MNGWVAVVLVLLSQMSYGNNGVSYVKKGGPSPSPVRAADKLTRAAELALHAFSAAVKEAGLPEGLQMKPFADLVPDPAEQAFVKEIQRRIAFLLTNPAGREFVLKIQNVGFSNKINSLSWLLQQALNSVDFDGKSKMIDDALAWFAPRARALPVFQIASGKWKQQTASGAVTALVQLAKSFGTSSTTFTNALKVGVTALGTCFGAVLQILTNPTPLQAAGTPADGDLADRRQQASSLYDQLNLLFQDNQKANLVTLSISDGRQRGQAGSDLFGYVKSRFTSKYGAGYSFPQGAEAKIHRMIALGDSCPRAQQGKKDTAGSGGSQQGSGL